MGALIKRDSAEREDRFKDIDTGDLRRIRANWRKLAPYMKIEFLLWVHAGEPITGNGNERGAIGKHRDRQSQILINRADQLGFTVDPYDSLSDLKRKSTTHFRIAAKKYHPDTGKEADPEKLHKAKEAKGYFDALMLLPVFALSYLDISLSQEIMAKGDFGDSECPDLGSGWQYERSVR